MLNDPNRPYKLYLADEGLGSAKRIFCESLEEIKYKLNNEKEHNEYLVIYHNFKDDKDELISHGYIEINRKKLR